MFPAYLASFLLNSTHMIYFDNNATTALLPGIRNSLPSLMADYANPSSQHVLGQQARQRVEESRAAVADMIGAMPGDVLFTSGGTEGISWVLAQSWDAIILSAVEHAAVLDAAKAAQQRGVTLSFVDVNADGCLNEDELATRLDGCRANHPSGRLLMSLMLANNETGVIFPIERLADTVKRHAAYLHVDAVQCVGKMPVDVNALQCDYLSVSAHKFHGLKGAGALYRRRQAPLKPIIHGHHEHGLRGGTENVPGIVAMGMAAQAAVAGLQSGSGARMSELRDKLERGLCAAYAGARVNGTGAKRLPNTTNILFPGKDGAMMVEALSGNDIFISAGAACSTGGILSHVLQAMGLTSAEANSSLRFSLSAFTTAEEVAAASEIFIQVINELPQVYQIQ